MPFSGRIWTSLIGIIFFVANVGCADYCNVTCDDGHGGVAKHTMCVYPTKNLGPACIKYDAENSVLTQEMKDEIVHVHNRFRSIVASGEENRGNPGPQPPAANMMELIWDNEMEMIAQRYALQCIYEHDSCRSKLDGTRGGQNLGIKAGDLSDTTSSIQGFYKEVKDLQPQQLQQSGSIRGGPKIGHYTQLVWGETSSVGCAIAIYEYPEYARRYGISELLVCNYHPTGNIRGAMVYQPGKACTACPTQLGCSTKYPGLCINPGSKGGNSTGEEVTPSQGGKPTVTPTVAPGPHPTSREPPTTPRPTSPLSSTRTSSRSTSPPPKRTPLSSTRTSSKSTFPPPKTTPLSSTRTSSKSTSPPPKTTPLSSTRTSSQSISPPSSTLASTNSVPFSTTHITLATTSQSPSVETTDQSPESTPEPSTDVNDTHQTPKSTLAESSTDANDTNQIPSDVARMSDYSGVIQQPENQDTTPATGTTLSDDDVDSNTIPGRRLESGLIVHKYDLKSEESDETVALGPTYYVLVISLLFACFS